MASIDIGPGPIVKGLVDTSETIETKSAALESDVNSAIAGYNDETPELSLIPEYTEDDFSHVASDLTAEADAAGPLPTETETDPTNWSSLTNIAAGVSGITTAAGSIVGAFERAAWEKFKADYARQQAEFHAAQIEIAAQQVLDDARTQQTQLKGRATRFKASQRAAAAGANVDVSSQSVQALQGDVDMIAMLDGFEIVNNAHRQAAGMEVQAVDQTSRAGMVAAASSVRATEGLITGGAQAAKSLTAAAFRFSRA